MAVSKTTDHIQIKIKMLNPSEDPPALTKAPHHDLKDMDVLCTLKFILDGKISEHWFIKDHWS